MPLPAGSVRHTCSKRLAATTQELVVDLIHRIENEPWHETQNLVRLLGILSTEIELRPTSINRYAAETSMMAVQHLAAHPDIDGRTLAELQGATCLDFGCGGLNPVGANFALLLAGAARGISVDLDDVRSLPCAARALYNVLCAAVTGTTTPRLPGTADEILARAASFDVDKLKVGDASGIDVDRLSYVQEPLHEVGLDDASIDVCFTNSVFEHLDDPDDIAAELARITKPGGFAVHAIDGYDHRYYADTSIHPLEFLRDASEDVLLFGCNRIRPLAFGEIFERHGFEVRGVLAGRAIELSKEFEQQLAPQFRDLPREHLEVARARYYLRRR